MNDKEQLSLFEEIDQENIIPVSIVSPIESTESVKSKRFRVQQLEFSRYVRTIQEHYECTFFEAKELFFEYRDEQKPIHINFDKLS